MKVAYGSYNALPRTSTLSNYTGLDSVSTTNLASQNGTVFPLVNLHVSAKKLKDVDIVTVSDPLCVFYIYNQGKWTESGRTEVIWNNLNPEWVTFFTIMYIFEIKQQLRFVVYDVDSDNANLSKQKIIGQAEVELSAIISAGGTYSLELNNASNKKDGKSGTLFITPEQVENCSSVVNFRFTGSNIKKLRVLQSNDPFYVIAKLKMR